MNFEEISFVLQQVVNSQNLQSIHISGNYFNANDIEEFKCIMGICENINVGEAFF
jgi:hypothetical protein